MNKILPLLFIPTLLFADRPSTPRDSAGSGPIGGGARGRSASPYHPSGEIAGGGTASGFGAPRGVRMAPRGSMGVLSNRPAFRPDGAPKATIGFFPGTRIVQPCPWERLTVMPDSNYWMRRDILSDMQYMSRSGSIPVTPVADGTDAVTDRAEFPSGWRAYGIAIPPGGKLRVALDHPKLGWFRLMAVNRLGMAGPGMLESIVKHQPTSFTLTNPTTEAAAVYVIVDDPAWWSTSGSQGNDPYVLHLQRDWDPAQVNLASVKLVSGIWATHPAISAEFRSPRGATLGR